MRVERSFRILLLPYYRDTLRSECELKTTINHLLTEAGKEELSELFSSLAAELNACKTKIMYIGVVASADTEEELHELGY